jgi:radical SAM protein with 4Fe4S-binding SPASM domain
MEASMSLNGLMSVNVELTSRCNKGDGTPGNGCWMCGRKKLEREHPELCTWGDMPLTMVKQIAVQVPSGVTVQLHNNGEPLLYPWLEEAIKLFSHCLTGLDTNGKLLVEREREIFNSGLKTITISIIQDDPEGAAQIGIIDEFLYDRECVRTQDGDVPLVILRLLGRIDYDRQGDIARLQNGYPDVIIARRVLHAPEMSRDYEAPVVVPEMGICLEALHKLSIDRFGHVLPCVRFNPKGWNCIGNINEASLDELWNSQWRQFFVRQHTLGKRGGSPLCACCDFYGIPRGPQ